MNTTHTEGPWIQTSDGTVCARCRLWPDRCTCDPNHPLWIILRAALAKARNANA